MFVYEEVSLLPKKLILFSLELCDITQDRIESHRKLNMKETFDQCDPKVFILGLTKVVNLQSFGISH